MNKILLLLPTLAALVCSCASSSNNQSAKAYNERGFSINALNSELPLDPRGLMVTCNGKTSFLSQKGNVVKCRFWLSFSVGMSDKDYSSKTSVVTNSEVTFDGYCALNFYEYNPFSQKRDYVNYTLVTLKARIPSGTTIGLSTSSTQSYVSTIVAQTEFSCTMKNDTTYEYIQDSHTTKIQVAGDFSWSSAPLDQNTSNASKPLGNFVSLSGEGFDSI